ncbi:MAG: carboxypeptidase regulatory-like domain-containing protein [Terracidiphilus sp.]
MATTRKLYALALCCFLSCTVAFGQIASTSLRGTVKDSSGAVVPAATVTATNQASGVAYHTQTNNAGFYVFPDLVPAHYLVTLTAKGFGAQARSAELLVSQPATIDFSLSVQAETVTVDVTSSAEALNLTDATMGNAVGNDTIQALPMDGRNPISLLTLQPGVLYIGNEVSDSRQGAVAGGRSDQGNVTLDGIDDNDEVYGTAFTGILRSTLDSTEEFKVTTSNGTAEAGRSSGAQINLLTKSGTNHLHGSLYEYYRPDNVVANSFFNKYSQLASSLPNEPQFYLVNTFGGSVGDRIVKDKLFYFFNYEGNRVGTHAVVGATLPTQSFMNGQLKYVDTNGNTDTLTTAQVANLDEPCTSNTTPAGQHVCPNGPGPNADILSYLGTTKLTATGTTLGDGGLNSGSYYFTSPAPSTLNTSIAKIDYIPNSRNRLFFRGNLQKDTAAGAENLPGQPAGSSYDDNTKGMAAGWTWTLTDHIVNDLRYGFVRQGFQYAGPGEASYVGISGLTQPEEICDCNTLRHVPVNEITDTVNWSKGNHTISVGANWRLVINYFGTNSDSFDGASTNPLYANNAGLPSPSTANGDPGNIDPTFYEGSWLYGWGNMVGAVPELTNVYNYKITSPTTGTALPDGAFVTRNYHNNEFEYFIQDTWHARRNLNVTLGVRHTLLQTPYEANGQQISPTTDIDAWYKQRETAALQGQVYEPEIALAPSGKANHQPGYWPKQRNNIAPRLGVVWSPEPNTSVRASFGMYYDHYGEALINDFDEFGSAGLATAITNGADSLTFEDSPRFTGVNNLPDIPLASSPTAQTFPYAPSATGFQIYWGLDNKMKTPYSEVFNFSIQHQFPKGFILEEAYVGRLGRHLLQQLDFSEPVDYVDPGGGGAWFPNATMLSKITDASSSFGNFTSNNPNPYAPCSAVNGGCTEKLNNNVPTIQYFEDVFPYMKGYDYAGESATQAIFNNAWSPFRYVSGETLSLAFLDAFGVFPGSPFYGGPNQSTFWADQFSSLYGLSTIGNSSYNALQFTLRHPSSHGLTLDFSYTFSKSLDLESETERGDVFTNGDNGYVDFGIQNTWNPKLNKAVSDFDTHSLFTADWVYALPVGRGKAALGGSNRVADALIGGWQFAGLARVTSGLPFSMLTQAYPTNYENPSWGIETQPLKLKKTLENGVPHVMDQNTTNAINNGVFGGIGPIRYPYPGEAGERNFFRGDGYFDVDSSLTKSWTLPEKMALKFAAEAYNITNSNRFDVSPAGLNPQLTQAGLGTYSSSLSTYRRMQFGLRLDF